MAKHATFKTTKAGKIQTLTRRNARQEKRRATELNITALSRELSTNKQGGTK